jgi:4-amino-4-deoxy-L-arabinose transferase-like glycosyltransferase
VGNAAVPHRRWRPDLVLLPIVVAAFVARVVLAVTQPLVHDEFNTSIPLAERISFDAGDRYLPIRATNHPALPAYIVKASTTLLDSKEPLGYRGLHVIASLVIVGLLYSLTKQWYGVAAARWAAALLAFNEYSLTVSSHATAHVPFLLFVTCAIWAFSRFLADQRPHFLYLAGASLALAFYAKEHAALLLPIFFLALLLPRQRAWLRRPHAYLAAVLFFAIVTPDVVWNLTRKAEAQVTYGRHLERIGGLGLSQYPTAFYLKAGVAAAQTAMTGEPFDDNTPEYRSMNVLLGALLLGSVVATTARRREGNEGRVYLLLLFWGVFGFFTLIRRGDPSGLDPVSWIWVDASMLPAIALTGAVLGGAMGKWRGALWAFAAFGLIVAVLRMFT